MSLYNLGKLCINNVNIAQITDKDKKESKGKEQCVGLVRFTYFQFLYFAENSYDDIKISGL